MNRLEETVSRQDRFLQAWTERGMNGRGTDSKAGLLDAEIHEIYLLKIYMLISLN